MTEVKRGKRLEAEKKMFLLISDLNRFLKIQKVFSLTFQHAEKIV